MEARDFHVLCSRDGQSYLFLAGPVAIFKIDEDTARVIRAVEQGGAPMGEFEHRRWHEASEFMENYCRKAPKAQVMRGPEDISDRVMGLYLFLSQKCNLKCAYCYGDEGEYGQRGAMKEEVLNRTFETFFNDGPHPHFITFFGGEPLMNMPMMRKTAELADTYRRAGKADVSMGIVTNGTIYSEKIKGFFDQYISDVTFSLDGPKELNDPQRMSKNGESVYDTAVANIRKLTEDCRFNWAFRTIVTSRGCDQVERIYDHLDQLAPGGVGVVNVDVPKDNPLYLDDAQYRRFIDQIIAVNRRGLRSFVDGERAVAFEYPFYIMYYFISRRHTLYHCNAGTNLLAVTAEGDVYPCHRFVGVEEFNMGNVRDAGLRTSERFRAIRAQFIESTVDNRPGCRECWARYLCGGSCAKYAHAEHGDINPPVERHCLYIKSVIEELLPDMVGIMENPAEKRALMGRLATSLSSRYGSKGLDTHVS
jgi:uncharacterized protein